MVNDLVIKMGKSVVGSEQESGRPFSWCWPVWLLVISCGCLQACTPQYTRQVVSEAYQATPFSQSLVFSRNHDWVISRSADVVVGFPVSEFPSAINHQLHEAIYAGLAARQHGALHYWQPDSVRAVLAFAQQMQAAYVVIPELLAYADGVNSVGEYVSPARDDATWSRDRILLKITLYDTVTGNNLDTATLTLENPVFHLSTQSPSELLTRAGKAYADAISH